MVKTTIFCLKSKKTYLWESICFLTSAIVSIDLIFNMYVWFPFSDLILRVVTEHLEDNGLLVPLGLLNRSLISCTTGVSTTVTPTLEVSP